MSVQKLSLRALGCAPIILVLVGSAAGCDGRQDGSPGSTDPRCAVLCTDEPSHFEGAYDVCSSESLAQCVALCEARVDDVSSLCAECLLEDAYLDDPVDMAVDLCVDAGDCYVGLSRVCVDGCWIDESGSSCSDGSCDGARAEYEMEVARGDACSYREGDEVGRASCHSRLHPREEVACEVEFGTVTACADVCG